TSEVIRGPVQKTVGGLGQAAHRNLRRGKVVDHRQLTGRSHAEYAAKNAGPHARIEGRGSVEVAVRGLHQPEQMAALAGAVDRVQNRVPAGRAEAEDGAAAHVLAVLPLEAAARGRGSIEIAVGSQDQ